jgi:hypothetical protein
MILAYPNEGGALWTASATNAAKDVVWLFFLTNRLHTVPVTSTDDVQTNDSFIIGF